MATTGTAEVVGCRSEHGGRRRAGLRRSSTGGWAQDLLLRFVIYSAKLQISSKKWLFPSSSMLIQGTRQEASVSGHGEPPLAPSLLLPRPFSVTDLALLLWSTSSSSFVLTR
jgi:hypothetical protein